MKSGVNLVKEAVCHCCLVAELCRLFVAPWTVALQAPLFMAFSRQEYWSGLPFLSAEDHPDPGIKPESPAWQAGSLPFELLGKPTTWIEYQKNHLREK